MFKIIVGILLIVVVLIIIALLRTITIKNHKLETGEAINIDKEREKKYGEVLSELIKVETVSSRYDEDREKFFKFHKELENQFPNIHRVCEKVVLNGSLLFKWSGKSKSRPIMFMSHHDVVEAPGEWTYPPFSGAIVDNVVWGRGTVDTKGNLFCFLMAIEEMISSGFTPSSDIYIASTCTEEWAGEGGSLICNYLKENNVKLEMILDEGGMVVDEPIKGVKGTYALIGVMEKGIGDIKIIAKGNGGHASAPPKKSPIARLAGFINEVEKSNPFKVEFNSTVTEMFRRMTPNMNFGMKFIFANLWLFKPLLKKFMPYISATGSAMLQTTCAFTTQKGSEGLNVLPQEAYVTANMRFIPHQGTDESIDVIRSIANKYELETEIISKSYPCPVVDYNSNCFKTVEETIKRYYPNVIPSPYVMTGGTDCKFFDDVCNNSIRFSPLRINHQQLDSIHAKDENISVSALVIGVDFFKDIIENWR